MCVQQITHQASVANNVQVLLHNVATVIEDSKVIVELMRVADSPNLTDLLSSIEEMERVYADLLHTYRSEIERDPLLVNHS